MKPLTYGSVCSGIEAATVAWHVLGWAAEWFAEIEDFPSKVLAHHYPKVPNLGDMTKIAAMIRARLVSAPDVLVGGTPCQAFSVAGMRESLDDARGQLTLSYVELADEIDRVRIADGKPECIIVWENVPGVLNTKDNAFGCFLAGLAGEDCTLVPPGGRWPNAGCVYGPQRTVAWRVTDAQYFGVAQRRRRVFVVASAREGFDPTEVLFEFDGLRRDSAPSREAREETAGALTARAEGGGFPGTDEAAAAGYVQPVRVGGPDAVICMATGQGGAEILENRALTLTCNHEAPIAVYCADITGTLAAADGPHGVSDQYAHEGKLMAYAFDSRQECVSSPHVFGALGSSSPQAQAVAHVAVMPTMRSGGPNGGLSHGQVSGDTLKAEGFDASEDGTGRGQPIIPAMAFAQNSRDEVRLMGGDGQLVGALAAQPGMKQTCYIAQPAEWGLVGGWAVRRLTPRECERLQSFPDDYTLIPVKKAKKRSKMYDYVEIDGELWQLAADGPRYKALGNSMCVYNMRWIGQRIHQHLTNPYADLIA